MSDLVHVRAIARRARTDAEIIAPDYGFNARTLKGFCVVTTIRFLALAQRSGIEAVFCAGRCCKEPHGWAELVGCRTIVELTGRQFRARWGAVVLLRVGSAWRSLYQRYYEGMAGGPRINLEQLKVLARLPAWWRAGDPMP